MTINSTSTPKKDRSWLFDLLLIGVLLIAAYFRFTGENWGNLLYQHPDEGFMIQVTAGIQPIGASSDLLGPPPTTSTQAWRAAYPQAYPNCKAWGGYFDTACSPMNPPNRGYSFYVYGDLPLYILRYLADWFKQTGNLTLFGRYLSATMDLGTIALLYFIVKRVYNHWVALLAAAFSALAVMQIQQSHYFTTDNFLIFFMTLTVYFAVLIATGNRAKVPVEEKADEEPPSPGVRVIRYLKRLGQDPLTYLSIGFGVALGMAAGSKINAAVMAALLPLALTILYFRLRPSKPARGSRAKRAADPPTIKDYLSKIFVFLVIGGIFSLLSFRIFQPYAFVGFRLSPQWLENIREVINQASPNADMPWALQWARRTHLYSFQNLTVWGLGLPLGILAWAGFLWMAWRIVRGEWKQHLLLWGWTAGYFIWQSLVWNPTMRYELPIYPFLAMMAAWGVFELVKLKTVLFRRIKLGFVLGWSLGGIVLVLTAAWAFAFTRIYTRPEPRVAASAWIYQNIAGSINMRIRTSDGSTYQEPLPYPAGNKITPEAPFTTSFVAQASGTLTQVLIGHIADTDVPSAAQTLSVVLLPLPASPPEQALGIATATADFAPGSDARRSPNAYLRPTRLREGWDHLFLADHHHRWRSGSLWRHFCK